MGREGLAVTQFYAKTGITKGGTFLSLGVVCGLLLALFTAVSWVNGMDAERGRQLSAMSDRVTRVEAHEAATTKALDRIEEQLDDIHDHLIKR
jgi:hypothetical protein